ncbi:helix-turn-helix transcriptional regulator [Bacillus arachidis]|uniref:helix-turn-helix transcriptional regulator n=1 Tax=Bacillus arachidis TaxID=2819290 RepID=UPI0032E7F807
MYRIYTDVVKRILQVRRNDVENQICALRTEKNISQGALADKCKVSRQTINAIENNKYDPSLALAFRLAEVLGTTVDQLFLYK